MFTSRHFLMRAYLNNTVRRAAVHTNVKTNASTSASVRTAGTAVKALSVPLELAANQQRSAFLTVLLGVGAATTATALVTSQYHMHTHNCTNCAASLAKTGGDVVMLAPKREKSTGILFPHLCNGMTFVGCGVRIKYGFVKVYAVGTYMDPIAMSAVQKQGYHKIEEALLDPTYPRTIRIVMNRGLSIEKYTAAIVEALGPRMNGEDLEKLEEFKKLNPSVDLVEGAEMEMTVRGNIMLYKNSLGGVGQIDSKVFCKALCDVYYGNDPVSPGHKEEVIKGVQNL